MITINIASRRHSLKVSFLIATILLAVTSGVAYALPVDPTVISGSSTINQISNTMTITQTTSKSIINWQSYTVDVSNLVKYIQPGTGSISLNSGSTSVVLGVLQPLDRISTLPLQGNGSPFGSTGYKKFNLLPAIITMTKTGPDGSKMLDLTGDGMITYKLDAKLAEALPENADGATILIEPNDLIGSVVNMSGVVEAKSANVKDGDGTATLSATNGLK